jgi:hypothetical protein
MEDEPTDAILKTFKGTLQALALPPAEQVRVTMPGCVTCDLYEDFTLYHRLFLGESGETLTPAQQEALARVVETLEAVPPEAQECFEASMLEHQAWADVRGVAQAALKELGWAAEAPSEFQQVKPGVWHRPL